jgi:hypothetical protein
MASLLVSSPPHLPFSASKFHPLRTPFSGKNAMQSLYRRSYYQFPRCALQSVTASARAESNRWARNCFMVQCTITPSSLFLQIPTHFAVPVTPAEVTIVIEKPASTSPTRPPGSQPLWPMVFCRYPTTCHHWPEAPYEEWRRLVHERGSCPRSWIAGYCDGLHYL